jgi:hypothetical protein
MGQVGEYGIMYLNILASLTRDGIMAAVTVEDIGTKVMTSIITIVTAEVQVDIRLGIKLNRLLKQSQA